MWSDQGEMTSCHAFGECSSNRAGREDSAASNKPATMAQEHRRPATLAQLNLHADPNEELGPKSIFIHAPLASRQHPSEWPMKTSHRSQVPAQAPEARAGCWVAQPPTLHGHARREQGCGDSPCSRLIPPNSNQNQRRRAASPKRKRILFRASGSMSEQRGDPDADPALRGKVEAAWVCLLSTHYLFHADARFDHARKYGPNNQGGDGCCNLPNG